MGFDSNEVAGACVSDIIKAGVLPVAIEFMDRPCIERLRGLRQGRLPDVRGAADRRGRGLEAEIDEQLGRIIADRAPHNPVELRERNPRRKARDLEGPQIRLRRDGPDQRLHVPRRHDPGLRAALRAAPHRRDVEGLRAGRGNVFHAGDGNMHPLILFDANKPGDLEPARPSAPRS
jgi:glycolate oxidase